jgi:hypothetical protein
MLNCERACTEQASSHMIFRRDDGKTGRGRAVTKEVVGIHVLLARSLFGGDILRKWINFSLKRKLAKLVACCRLGFANASESLLQ